MKLTIGSLDNVELAVEAHYNPKEIDLAKQATWRDDASVKAHAGTGDKFDLEYQNAPPRTMSLELLFDGFESATSIEPQVAGLQELASPIDETATKYDARRPHICVVVWADSQFPRFQCVIESVAIKYTMFSKHGRPLRATCQVKLKEIRPQHRRQVTSFTTYTGTRNKGWDAVRKDDTREWELRERR